MAHTLLARRVARFPLIGINPVSHGQRMSPSAEPAGGDLYHGPIVHAATTGVAECDSHDRGFRSIVNHSSSAPGDRLIYRNSGSLTDCDASPLRTRCVQSNPRTDRLEAPALHGDGGSMPELDLSRPPRAKESKKIIFSRAL